MESGLIVSGGHDHRIAQIAALQRGFVTRRQLLAAGISDGAITRRRRRGTLIDVRRGVYAAGHRAPAPWALETAALLAVQARAGLAAASAGHVWDIHTPRAGAAIELVVPVARARDLPGVTVHRARALLPHDLTVRAGLPLTSVSRTLLDLAASPEVSDRQLELAYDRARVARILRPTQVDELLARAGGHPGRGRLRAIHLHQSRPTTFTRSEAEERMLELVRQAGLPPPHLNARLLGFEVDCLWADARVVVEVDSARYHLTRRAFDADHRKATALEAHGYTVIRCTRDQLFDAPLQVIAAIARALGAGTGRGGGGANAWPADL